MIKQFLVTSIQGLLAELQNENPAAFQNTGSMQRILLDHLIRWYVQVNEDEQDVYGLYMTDWVDHAKVTRLAAQALREVCQTQEGHRTRSMRQGALRKVVHFEHNAPVKVKRLEMLQLLQQDEILREDVERILNAGYGIEVISTVELAHLNGHQLRANGTAVERTEALQGEFYGTDSMYLSANEREQLKNELALFLEA